ncbi:helix-turn-helix domain-containing protein [Neobacillus sp. SuZ13]|uniref:helix-turn-helix domain-containing protein n=1 Tax=Neobacillus sp. SuZ13 TaxID=3047875 RepID=UPI0024BF977B|nr:helix-turn-helix domain-containing protein [Neobacillus sp. SuZ13]WHY64666.1 helix-turn-helix domain-containing protein [Neobacillus sp. SuZ13]
MTNDKKVMLDVRDVMAITGLGRNNAYELMKSGEFHVKTIGKKYLVHEEVFQNWLKGNSKTKKRW